MDEGHRHLLDHAFEGGRHRLADHARGAERVVGAPAPRTLSTIGLVSVFVIGDEVRRSAQKVDALVASGMIRFPQGHERACSWLTVGPGIPAGEV
jgi:hypothetical protein